MYENICAKVKLDKIYKLTLLCIVYSFTGLANTQTSNFRTGFAKLPITPIGFDSWIDKNGNAQKDKNEPYLDLNKNGRFDPIYLAGFQQNRPATGVHDDIFAIASVIEQQNKKIAFVTLDTIGFMIDEVDDIRNRLNRNLKIDHLVIHSLHNHEAPDTQGLWGPSLTKTGINLHYLEYVKTQVLSAVEKANQQLSASKIHYTEIQGEDSKFGVVDTRVPYILEEGIKSVVFTDIQSGEVKGTWVYFSNHVETIWNKNLEITADWPGYLRKGIESGIKLDSRAIVKGIGGITSVFIGNIGGLATTLPETPVYDIRTKTFRTGATFEKVAAQGYTIADSVLKKWQTNGFHLANEKNIFIKQRRFDLTVKNKLFILANRLGVLKRNMRGVGVIKTTSEINHIGLGPIEILTIPGELYPEIALGGIVNLPGSDYDVAPEETPPLYEIMGGNLKMIFNLTNDSIGYIIPYTEWDQKKPYLNLGDSTYGESNSVGDTSGRQIYREAKNTILEN